MKYVDKIVQKWYLKVHMGTESPQRTVTVTVTVPLLPQERRRFDVVCGRNRRDKRGQWVREAIVEKLDREAIADPVSAEEKAG
jgi:hypothetical protein